LGPCIPNGAENFSQARVQLDIARRLYSFGQLCSHHQLFVADILIVGFEFKSGMVVFGDLETLFISHGENEEVGIKTDVN
jgi:hypothetical protein